VSTNVGLGIPGVGAPPAQPASTGCAS
jgi:hypothetical protein